MNKLSKWLIKASFIGSFAEALLVPFWVVLSNKVGGDVLDAGIAVGIFNIVTGLTVLAIGRTNWYKEHTHGMVFWGFLVSGIAEVSYIFAHTIPELFVVQSIVGISVGILNPAWDSLFTDDGEDGESAARWSFWSGGVEFICGFASILGGFIVTYFGFNALFISMGIADAFATYFAWKVKIHPELNPE